MNIHVEHMLVVKETNQENYNHKKRTLKNGGEFSKVYLQKKSLCLSSYTAFLFPIHIQYTSYQFLQALFKVVF
jgi:hypothetical protein